MAETLAEAAPAKLNLALHVTGRRPDGYHDLESVVVFAGVGDDITATPAGEDSLSIGGPFSTGLSAGADNLVMRAVAGFRQRWPEAVSQRYAFHLEKNLPVASGLGGGSADAAAALRLLVRLADREIPLPELAALALELGADVPMCLLSRPAEVRGVGEMVHPLPDFPPAHVVLVNPLVAVSTPDVFRRLEKRDNPGLPPLPNPLTRPTQLAIWLDGTRNDLERPAVTMVPRIASIIARLARTEGCLLARMSGSGASVFGLYGSGAQAHQAAHDLREDLPDCWVAAAPLLEP